MNAVLFHAVYVKVEFSDEMTTKRLPSFFFLFFINGNYNLYSGYAVISKRSHLTVMS